MKTLLRISWLIAGTLFLTRLIASAVEQLFDLLSWTFDLPKSFVHRLNAFILLTVSFALVSTLGWLIDHRKSYPLKDNLRLVALTFFLGLSAAGLYTVSVPIARDWKSLRESAQEYDSAIWSLRWAVKWAPSDGAYRVFRTPDDTETWALPRERPVGRVSYPARMSDQEIEAAFEAQFLQPRPAFSLATALRSHSQSLFLGLAFVALGLLGFRRSRRRLSSQVAPTA